MIQVDTVFRAIPRRLQREWGDLFDWPALAATGGRLVAALVVGWLAFWALRAVLRRIERSVAPPEHGTISLHEQRVRTLTSLVRSVGIVVILLIVTFMVLGALGVDLRPLLAGAGVMGLAISFGAQSLVKDVISGLFILFENQFGVGDVIRIDTVSGTVESMTLRVVSLRDIHGTLHVIPNGEIKRVSNLTRSWSRAVLDVSVAYDEDVDEVMRVMREVGADLHADPAWAPLLMELPEVPGIERFAESSVDIRMMAKTIPLKQWDVARELRRRLKLRFDRDGISIPFPHRRLVLTDGQPAPAAAAAQATGDAPA